jgi:deoxyribonuclease-4
VDLVVDRAVERECNTLQMFSRNPRRWLSRELGSEEIANFKKKLLESRIDPVFIHTPYLVNLASPKENIYRKSVEALKGELVRAGMLGVQYVVTHLGSHLGYGKKIGYNRVIDAVNASLAEAENSVVILLENTAGTKNSVGSSFEDISHILTRIHDAERVGVCFDTCHAFATGYDLVSRGAVENTLARFNETIGLEKLKLVHLNDSKGGLGSGSDRHEHIGIGKIGETGFKNILKSEFGKRPLILETPIDNRRNDLENLEKVRELAHAQN